jgi:hypothetical protein
MEGLSAGSGAAAQVSPAQKQELKRIVEAGLDIVADAQPHCIDRRRSSTARGQEL